MGQDHARLRKAAPLALKCVIEQFKANGNWQGQQGSNPDYGLGGRKA